MSWDAHLGEHDWNYTHNCNGMIDRVLDTIDPIDEYPKSYHPSLFGRCWWRTLDSMTGKQSIEFLNTIVSGLMEAPELFRSMNPKNGWGSYDSLLGVLVEMLNAAIKDPDAVWEVGG